MTRGSLYERPDLYDLMAPTNHAMESFYLATMDERPGPLLELACGSGRLTVPLAKTGRQVVGGDSSDTMLRCARAQADRCNAKADFIKLDMRDFGLNGMKFDTIVIVANSFMHLKTVEDYRGFFASVAKHLSEDGRLVFDIFVPSTAFLNAKPSDRWRVGEAVHAELGPVYVEETGSYDPVTQVRSIDWYWSTKTERDFAITSFSMRQVFPQELRALVALGGFKIDKLFGDFDRSPLTTSSPRQIPVCVPM